MPPTGRNSNISEMRDALHESHEERIRNYGEEGAKILALIDRVWKDEKPSGTVSLSGYANALNDIRKAVCRDYGVDDRLSYHDLHITTPNIRRTSIARLPFRVEVSCTRVDGWCVWARPEPGISNGSELLGGEFNKIGLRLDVAGIVIVDTLGEDESDES